MFYIKKPQSIDLYTEKLIYGRGEGANILTVVERWGENSPVMSSS
jgi:hypothetical protein